MVFGFFLVFQHDIDRRVVEATEKAFDINVESLFGNLTKQGDFIRELQKLSLAPAASTCFSCQVGLAQHIDHKDLLKVESLVYNQIRGFKTRHSQSAGVGGGDTASSTRHPNDFEGYRLATGGSGRPSQYSNDPNQQPLSNLVNRVQKQNNL